MTELPIPEEVRQDVGAVELFRGWIAGDALQCTLQADALPDPSEWGLVLAELVRHVSVALAHSEGVDAGEARRRIVEAMQNDLQEASDEQSSGEGG